ncbi:MAG TPA: hypothetical protein VMN04_05500 [Thermoanaerobaculia bacterium]|nr:hypothetical protein [Thermoanaerobaculia bacterium]
MKARFVAIAALALPLVAAAGIVIEELPASLSLKQAVRLADGSVLPAGSYDVKIEYRGFGNAATLHFFKNGVLKGNSPAEARGFPAQPPPALSEGVENKKYQKEDGIKKLDVADAKEVKLEPGDDKIKIQDKWEPADKSSVPPGAPQTFSWGVHGFSPGAAGKTAPAGPGQVKVLFDSTNSAAGFSAILPYVERARK